MTHTPEKDAPFGHAPAPWQLEGDAYILMLKFPRTFLEQHTFIPPQLQGKRSGHCGYLMFVHYRQSDVGPYDELLFIPGTFRFPDGKRYWSISRIYVSSHASVWHGQRNWGIPKAHADFSVAWGKDGTKDDEIRLSHQGEVFAQLRFRARRWGTPFSSGWTPQALRTLSQLRDDTMYTFAPEVKARLHPARLLEAKCDPAYFPDIAQGTVLTAVKLSQFRMQFPVAHTRDLTTR